MHACMIEGLDVREGEHVLDIGSGCGVTSAILSYLVRSCILQTFMCSTSALPLKLVKSSGSCVPRQGKAKS
jgi:cyclopropane fatty-acyl-phospholipid synthase-like methyltransferase